MKLKIKYSFARSHIRNHAEIPEFSDPGKSMSIKTIARVNNAS